LAPDAARVGCGPCPNVLGRRGVRGPGRLPGLAGGHRPPVPLADRPAQHRRPGRSGTYRADPRSGRGDRPPASGTGAPASIGCDLIWRGEAGGMRATSERAALKVALLGCGSVGSAVYRLLAGQSADLTARAGAGLEVVGVAVRDQGKARAADVAPA